MAVYRESCENEQVQMKTLHDEKNGTNFVCCALYYMYVQKKRCINCDPKKKKKNQRKKNK